MPPRQSRVGLILMAAPLYGGPLLAGWMRAPWLTPAVLAAMFFMAHVFSGRSAARGERPLALYLLVLALTQALLVLTVYAAGAGLSALVGVLRLPLWMPLAVTMLGAALYGLLYPYDPKQGETISLLDQALHSIDNGTGAEAEAAGETEDTELRDAVQQAIAALWALPPDAPAEALDAVIDELEDQVGHRALPDLIDRVDSGFPQLDRAFLRYLARPALRRRLIAGQADPQPAFALLLMSDEPDVRAELVTLVRALLEAGAPAAALPPADLLRARAEDVPEFAPLVAPVDHAAITED